jgi:hypothetical protein
VSKKPPDDAPPDEQRLPKILTEPRHDSENDESSWVERLSALSRQAAGELARFLDQWFDNWFRLLLTGVILGGMIGLMYKCDGH